jgi:hypothetical protein
VVTLPLLLALHDGGMGHDRLEAAMFWVGALLAGLPVLVLGGVFFYIRWQKKKAAEGSHPVDPA